MSNQKKKGVETYGPDRMFEILKANASNWAIPWGLAEPIVKQMINAIYSDGFTFSYIHDDDTMELLKNSWIYKKPIYFAISQSLLKQWLQRQRVEIQADDPKIAATQASLSQLLGGQNRGEGTQASNGSAQSGGPQRSDAGAGNVRINDDQRRDSAGSGSPGQTGQHGGVHAGGIEAGQGVQPQTAGTIVTPPPKE